MFFISSAVTCQQLGLDSVAYKLLLLLKALWLSVISISRRDKSFADDLFESRYCKRCRVAFVLRSAEVHPVFLDLFHFASKPMTQCCMNLLWMNCGALWDWVFACWCALQALEVVCSSSKRLGWSSLQVAVLPCLSLSAGHRWVEGLSCGLRV